MPSSPDRPLSALSLIVALLALAGCSAEDFSLDLPSIGQTSGPSGAKASRAPVECDDLPELTDEELNKPPFAPPRLEKGVARTNAAPPSFRRLPDVELEDAVSDKVSAIDAAYVKR